MEKLRLAVLPWRLAVCRLPADQPLPDRPPRAPFWAVTQTEEELSIVLPEDQVPAGCEVQAGWRCLKVAEPLTFEMVGVLASLAVPLTDAGVSILALSTYDTDYVLVREDDLEAAQDALADAGHVFVG